MFTHNHTHSIVMNKARILALVSMLHSSQTLAISWPAFLLILQILFKIQYTTYTNCKVRVRNDWNKWNKVRLRNKWNMFSSFHVIAKSRTLNLPPPTANFLKGTRLCRGLKLGMAEELTSKAQEYTSPYPKASP